MNVRLLVIQGKPAGKQLLFGPGEYYLGRGPECQIRFNSDWVSRQHAVLSVFGGGASLRDLGSRNGTLLNGVLLRDTAALSDGDKVQVGPVTFEIRIDAVGGSGNPGSGSVLRDPDAPDTAGGEPDNGSTAMYPPIDLGQ